MKDGGTCQGVIGVKGMSWNFDRSKERIRMGGITGVAGAWACHFVTIITAPGDAGGCGVCIDSSADFKVYVDGWLSRSA
jgi:hypothetical protein